MITSNTHDQEHEHEEKKMENGQELVTECAQCLRSESSGWIVACTIEFKYYEREKTIRIKKILNIGLCFPR